MSIKINMHPNLQQYTNGQNTVEVEGNTVGECLDHLVKQFPTVKKQLFNEKGELLNYFDVYVNLKSAYPEELAKPVKDGDEIHLVILIAGG